MASPSQDGQEKNNDDDQLLIGQGEPIDNNNAPCNDEQNQEKIELYVKYEPSDMLGHDSASLTPQGDESPNPDETDAEKPASTPTNIDANNQDNAKSTSSTSNNNNNNNNNNINSDELNAKEGGVIIVQESEEEGSESIEIELESDNSLLLTSLTSLFPEATGLKFRLPESNTFRGVKLVEGKFVEPLDGWSSGVRIYVCVFNRGSKRKNDEEDERSSKLAKSDIEKPLGDNGSDLVVLGLPWTTTEETMKSYFEQYGEVVMVQVKTDPKSGKSRGFGFVRFAKSSIQSKLLSMRHFIDGRWCDVRVPLSKAEAEATKAAQLSRKIFVGRLPDSITTDDLRNHFSEYGTLTDVFIPKPFRNFAFVTFGTSDMAQSIFKHKHIIKGTPVQISEAIPRDSGPNNYGGAFGGGGGGVGGGGGGGGPQNNPSTGGGYASPYLAGPTNSVHPFNSNYNAHQASHHYKNSIGAGFGNMYQNSRKMHPQSTYYQMPSYGSSGPSSVDSTSYVNHSAHSDYGNFVGTTNSYSQPSVGVNGGQYYKMQQTPTQQQAIIPQSQSHNTYPNQSSYSSHGANFSRSSYGSVWK